MFLLPVLPLGSLLRLPKRQHTCISEGNLLIRCATLDITFLAASHQLLRSLSVVVPRSSSPCGARLMEALPVRIFSVSSSLSPLQWKRGSHFTPSSASFNPTSTGKFLQARPPTPPFLPSFPSGARTASQGFWPSTCSHPFFKTRFLHQHPNPTATPLASFSNGALPTTEASMEIEPHYVTAEDTLPATVLSPSVPQATGAEDQGSGSMDPGLDGTKSATSAEDVAKDGADTDMVSGEDAARTASEEGGESAEKELGGQRKGDGQRMQGEGGQGEGGRGEGHERVTLKRGQEVELLCESLAFKGVGVCKLPGSDYVLMCEKALPGERLVARVTKAKQSYAEAYKLRTISPHANAVTPPCEHFGSCGGCRLQNLEYSAQLAAKEQQVADLMERTGGFGPRIGTKEDGTREGYLKPILGCEEAYHYRNKMEFSFGTRVWRVGAPMGRKERACVGERNREIEDLGKGEEGEGEDVEGEVEANTGGEGAKKAKEEGSGFALGLHAPRRFDKILPINECYIQDEVANQVLMVVREFCSVRKELLPAYDPITHEGFLRHLTIRKGQNPETGELELMVVLVTKLDKPELLQPLVEELTREVPAVASFIHVVNPSLSDSVPSGSLSRVLSGRDHISIPLRGLSFQISAASFFQTNTAQAEVLYREVESACELKGDKSETVLDLFCGTGSIGLSLARKVGSVVGFEIVPEAVEDAKGNAERNGIANARFVQGDLSKVLPVVAGGATGVGSTKGGNTSSSAQTVTSPSPSPPFRPDIIITDPNRPGMHPKLLKHLAAVRAPRIVYVSCNPATCARDISVLCHGDGEAGEGKGPYRLVSVQPVDMFPHTPHVECIATLVLKE